MASTLNPFPGLRPFGMEEDYLFFGREPQTAELVKRLRKNRFLAVVGTSGSGKSSLVRAGMIPTLLAGRMKQVGSSWEVAMMRPGGNPITHVARALCEAELYDADVTDIVPHLRATISRSRFGLVEAVRQSDLESGTNLLLVVDQFEEIFRFRKSGSEEREQALDFVNLLLEAANQTEQSIYVVITMRSDFIGDCSQFEGLAEAVNDGEYLIPRLSRQQCQMAIEGPAKVAGGRICAQLVQRLLNDLGEDQDELPILQHALMRTWNHAMSRDASGFVDPASAESDAAPAIAVEDYEAIGGMSEALSQHADEVYEGLSDQRHRLVAEKIFRTLTERGSDNRGIRRPTRLQLLCDICDATPAETAEVLNAFRRPGVTFLMPPDTVELQRETVVDISHESLMRVWRRLHGWVEEEAQSARIYQRLADSSYLHQEGKAGLYRDPDLQIALSWQEANEPNEAWAVRYHAKFELAVLFLQQSRLNQQAEIDAKDAARQRELEQAKALAETQRLRVMEQQRAAGWLKGLAAAAAIIAVVAIAAFFAAVSARQEAEQNAQVAEQERRRAVLGEEQVAQQALEFKRKFYAANVLKAKYWHEAGNGGRAVRALMECPEDLRHWEWHRMKYLADQSEILIEGIDQLDHAVVSPDGKAILSSRRDGIYQLWGAASGEERWSVKQSLLPFSAKLVPAFQWDGALVFTPDSETLHLRDVASGRSIKSFPGQFVAIYSSPTQTLGLRLFPQASIVDLAGESSEIALQEQRQQITHACFDSSGAWVAACDFGGRFQLWYTENGEKFAAFNPELSAVRSIAISPDGRQLLGSDAFGRIKRWNAADMAEMSALSGHRQEVTATAYGPDSARIVSGDASTLIKVWDAFTGNELGTMRGHASLVKSLDFSPDANMPLVVSSSSDGTIRLWEPEPVSPVMTLQHGRGRTTLRQLDFSPDGKLLATTGMDRHVRIWDVNTGEEVVDLPRQIDHVVAVDFAPDGKRLVAGQWGRGGVHVWDTQTWEQILHLRGPTSGVAWVTYSPDGTLIAGAGVDRKIFLWNAETGEPLSALEVDLAEGNIDGLAFSPDGERIGICFGATRLGQVQVLDVATGALITSIQGPDSDMRSVAFSPDGRTIAVGVRQTKETLICDLQSGEIVRRLRHREDVLAGAFSPDGQRYFSGGSDDSLRVWDVFSGEELLLIQPLNGNIWGVAVSPDGRTLAAAQEFGTVYVWKTVIPPMTVRLRRIQREQEAVARLFREGQWSELVPHFLKLVGEDPDDSMHYLRAAAILAAANDREGYRQLCENMIEHFSMQRTGEVFEESERTTKVCSVLPGIIEPTRIPLAGFVDAMDKGETPRWFFQWGALTRAMVAHRNGEPEAVLNWVGQLDQSATIPVVKASSQLLSAMAYHALGRTVEAQQALDEASQLVEQSMSDLRQGTVNDWWNLLYAESFRREAKALIGQP